MPSGEFDWILFSALPNRIFGIMSNYVLLAIPLIIAVKFEQFNLVGVIVGIFMIQLVILADHLLKQITRVGGKQI